MIASLASLISYKFYAEESEKNKNVGQKKENISGTLRDGIWYLQQYC